MALTILVVSGGDSGRAKYIRPQLKDKDPRVRETALGMLGAVDDDAWFDPICDLCSDPDKEVRTRALRAGRAIATKHSLQDQFTRVMVGNVRHNDSGVRSDAIAMLGGLGQRDSWRHVAPMLDDTETFVRAQAAQTLMVLASPECGDAVVAAMGRERDKWARTYLAGAAQKLLLQKADAPLVSWLTDPDEEIRKLAEVTLKAIFAENFGSDVAKWQTWLQSRPK
jgi:HEAT repeat protein